MGFRDNRRSLKMRRRKGQAKKKARQRRVAEGKKVERKGKKKK